MLTVMPFGRLLSVTRHPAGPRVRVLGQRVHHGAVAVVAVAVLSASRRPGLVPLAVALAIHDAADWRWWFAIGDRQADVERTSSVDTDNG